MKTKTFKILYLNNGQWKNESNSFDTVNDAKNHVDELRKEGKHPLCSNHHVVIYEYEGKSIKGEGIRY